MGKHSALGAWQTTRRQVLDSLVLARQAIDTNHTDRSEDIGVLGVVENIDRALYPVLAAEFQGFCRDLHSETITAIVNGAAWPTERIQVLAVAAMKQGRGLDRKNPSSSVIGDDFRTLGLLLWQRVQEVHPEDYPDWRRALDTLVNIRNAVTHSDRKRINEFASKNQLAFAYWSATRVHLDMLVIAMDSVVRTYLAEIATPAPTQEATPAPTQEKGTEND